MAKTSKKKGVAKTKKTRASSKKTPVPKKSSKKHSSKKTEVKKIERKISSEREKNIDKALVENFIGLQKVMVNLSSKFDSLSTQISKLLELFEISAKSLAQKDFDEHKKNKDSEEIIKKLDNISQQAGLIGKGLVLIHEASSGRGFSTKGEGEMSREMRSMAPNFSQKSAQESFNPLNRSQRPFDKNSSVREADEKGLPALSLPNLPAPPTPPSANQSMNQMNENSPASNPQSQETNTQTKESSETESQVNS